MYNGSRVPLLVWGPAAAYAASAITLVQMIDMAPTLLEFFGVPIPQDMQGKPLRAVIGATSHCVRPGSLGSLAAMSMWWTGATSICGRAPGRKNEPCFEYTLMPTHMRSRFGVEELQDIQLAEPFAFTGGAG